MKRALTFLPLEEAVPAAPALTVSNPASMLEFCLWNMVVLSGPSFHISMTCHLSADSLSSEAAFHRNAGGSCLREAVFVCPGETEEFGVQHLASPGRCQEPFDDFIDDIDMGIGHPFS